MSIKSLTPAKIPAAGLQLTTVAMGAGDTGFSFVNDGNSIPVIKNGSASPITATVNATMKYKGLSITNPTVTIPAGQTKFFPVLDPSIYNGTGGVVQIDISAAATTIEGQVITF
jgi:hypothetical protein